ncbi:MAG TPA: ABC transporter permease [Egibacteraceae bacterium]|nr:ABC transporter permease [Egibacteraceae bacterium]
MTAQTMPARRGLARAASDVSVIVKRNMRRNLRLPQLLLFATVQPVMFLLLFTYVFGGAIGEAIPAAAAGKYINWLVPGLLVQVSVFGAGQTATGLTEDLAGGVIDRFRSLPMARSAVLAGRTLADAARNGFVMSLMLAVGALIGFRVQTSVLALIPGLALVLLFAFAMSWVMAAVGLLVKNPEAAQSAAFIPVFPLVFASSIFVPTQTMPAWLRAFADHQPITVTTNAVRGLLLGDGALPACASVAGQAAQSVLWSVAILAVFSILAVGLYRRAAQ